MKLTSINVANISSAQSQVRATSAQAVQSKNTLATAQKDSVKFGCSSC